MARPTGWENAYEIILTVDNTNIDSDLTNYPLCVNISDSAGITSKDLSAIFTTMSYSDRKKVGFFLSDQSTQGIAECECWDDVNEIATYHVKISSITAASTTTLYAYFDPAHTDNTTYIGDIGSSVGQSVWPSNHVGVWHMAQDPTISGACILDSTSSANHGVPNGSMIYSDLVNAQVGKALTFDGTDDYINCGYDSVLNITTTFTLEVVFNPTDTLDSSLTKNAGLISRQFSPTNSEDSYAVMINTSGRIQVGTQGGNIQSTTSEWIGGQDHVIACTYNTSGLTGDIFANGVKETLSNDNYDTMSGGLNNMLICLNSVALNEFYQGEISEIRIVNAVLSDAWLTANNYNLKDSLITFGDISAPYKVSGTVQESSANVARIVRAYDNSTGDLLGEDTSNSSTGAFEIGLLTTDSVCVVAIDDVAGDDYNALIYDKITPVAS